jgi:hypothetical protein
MSEPAKPEEGTRQQGMGLDVGLSLGAALGLMVFDNIGLGMAMGVAIGLVPCQETFALMAASRTPLIQPRNSSGALRLARAAKATL